MKMTVWSSASTMSPCATPSPPPRPSPVYDLIGFDPSLDGLTITLTGGQLTISSDLDDQCLCPRLGPHCQRRCRFERRPPMPGRFAHLRDHRGRGRHREPHPYRRLCFGRRMVDTTAAPSAATPPASRSPIHDPLGEYRPTPAAAIHNTGGTLTLTNTTLSGNTCHQLRRRRL